MAAEKKSDPINPMESGEAPGSGDVTGEEMPEGENGTFPIYSLVVFNDGTISRWAGNQKDEKVDLKTEPKMEFLRCIQIMALLDTQIANMLSQQFISAGSEPGFGKPDDFNDLLGRSGGRSGDLEK